MASVSAEEVYEHHVKRLSRAEQLRLLAMTADKLARLPVEHAESPKRDIMELHGLGKELWEGVDAQAYVDQLRDEWEPSP